MHEQLPICRLQKIHECLSWAWKMQNRDLAHKWVPVISLWHTFHCVRCLTHQHRSNGKLVQHVFKIFKRAHLPPFIRTLCVRIRLFDFFSLPMFLCIFLHQTLRIRFPMKADTWYGVLFVFHFPFWCINTLWSISKARALFFPFFKGTCIHRLCAVIVIYSRPTSRAFNRFLTLLII